MTVVEVVRRIDERFEGCYCERIEKAKELMTSELEQLIERAYPGESLTFTVRGMPKAEFDRLDEFKGW